MDTERFIEADAHVGKPSGDLIFRRINLASPMPIQKSPETGALPAMAVRQCQKSGNGFPPDAAFLPLGTLLENTTSPGRSWLASESCGPEKLRSTDTTPSLASQLLHGIELTVGYRQA
ncbi:hypothetical protein [Pseudomonas sp. GM55]|uniref:hypothetical protein n=1 Tax=Pseudomonas sp. GM55 TaxID=1144333 RepID=UPI0012F9A40E|nr:hypothetical protein [Pseudomonas sp. GM55]